jgi:hypothetical protein
MFINIICWSCFLSGNSRSSRIKLFLARNFRELHVYLSRNPCWATMPLTKIHSSPAKLRQIKDHFLVALWACSSHHGIHIQGRWLLIRHFFGRLTESPPSKCTLTFARSFAELSLNFCQNMPIRTQPSAEGASEEKHTPQTLVFGQLAKPHLWKLDCYLCREW